MPSGIRISLFLVMSAVFMGRPNAAEYFVGKGGNDAHDGLSRERAFLTIQKGVDALQPGDTLTIAPGEYSEAVRRDKLGGPDAETVIRAEIPGTVLIRGDVPLPAFRKVEGYRFLYAADFESETAIRTVNDLDALDVYPCLPSIAVLDFRPGSACYDPEAKKVYVSTCDYEVSKIEYFGAGGQIVASAEMKDYVEVGDGFAVPGSIAVISGCQSSEPVEISVELGKVRQVELSSKSMGRLFERPAASGFDRVIRIGDPL